MKVVYFIVAFLVSYLVFKFGLRPALNWFEGHSDVTARMSTRPWPDKLVLANEVALETPFKLIPNEHEWPEGAKELFIESTSYSYEEKNLSITALTISYHPGVTLDLEGAVDGALAGLRAVPGTTKVDTVKREKVDLGDGGRELEARVVRHGETAEIHQLIFLRQRRLYQLIFVVPPNHKQTAATWERMKSSVHFLNSPERPTAGSPAKPIERATGILPLPPGMQRKAVGGEKPVVK